ncbi:hypothetical protein [Mesorhizobium sp.]|nr:hypothetical protein [Mesorhizobium sp.]
MNGLLIIKRDRSLYLTSGTFIASGPTRDMTVLSYLAVMLLQLF